MARPISAVTLCIFFTYSKKNTRYFRLVPTAVVPLRSFICQVSSNMATSVATKDVNSFLTQKQNVADKELAAEWAQLEELYSKR